MEPLAIYAAAVGTGSLGWQVVSQLRADRTKVEVVVAGSFDGAVTVETHELVAIVINHSRHDLPMPGVNVYQPSIGREWPIRPQDVVGGLPDLLLARGAVTLRVPSSRFVGMEFADAVVATVITATGQHFTSKLTKIGHIAGQPSPS